MAGRCLICTERFDLSEIAALKCGHTFHFHCISHWLHNRPTCPSCRRTIRASDIVQQLFFDMGEDSMLSVSASPASSPSVLKERVRTLEEELEQTKEAKKALENDAKKARQEALASRNRNRELDDAMKVLQRDVLRGEASFAAVEEQKTALAKKCNDLENSIQQLQAIDRLVNEALSDDHFRPLSGDVREISVYLLKKKNMELGAEKQNISQRNKALERENAALKSSETELKASLEAAQDELKRLKSDQEKVVVPKKSIMKCPVTSTPKQSTATTESQFCRESNLPFVKTTNLAATLDGSPISFSTPLAIKRHYVIDSDDSSDDCDGYARVPISGRSFRRKKNGASSSTMRSDGFGGRAAACENIVFNKRMPNAPKKKRQLTPKIKSKTVKVRKCAKPGYNIDDSSIIVISE